MRNRNINGAQRDVGAAEFDRHHALQQVHQRSGPARQIPHPAHHSHATQGRAHDHAQAGGLGGGAVLVAHPVLGRAHRALDTVRAAEADRAASVQPTVARVVGWAGHDLRAVAHAALWTRRRPIGPAQPPG